jgi:hypothetical protein
MQVSSLPINSLLQNNHRYQFTLKSEHIEILQILSAAILKMVAIRSRFFFNQNILPTLNIYAKFCGNPFGVSDISEVKILTYAHGLHGNGGHFENYKE